jgi:hypothetical protein
VPPPPSRAPDMDQPPLAGASGGCIWVRLAQPSFTSVWNGALPRMLCCVPPLIFLALILS